MIQKKPFLPLTAILEDVIKNMLQINIFAEYLQEKIKLKSLISIKELAPT